MRNILTAVALALITVALAVRAIRPHQTAGPLQHATFAAGCFWSVEAAFRRTHGVVATAVGYTGGHTDDHPTYYEVGLGHTGHAEAVEVTYDPRQISYAELLDVFWSCHDPTIDRTEGPHASTIFFHDAAQEATARASLEEVAESNTFKRPIVTRILPAGLFYPAEDYHQRYLEKNGFTEACHVGPTIVRTRLASVAADGRFAAACPMGLNH